MTRALVAEFTHEQALDAAVKAVEAHDGFRLVDTYTPFKPRENEEAERRVRVIIRNAIIAGLIVAAILYLVQLLSSILAYPIDSGGRPHDSWPVFIPAAFEVGVFSASAAGFVTFLALGRLPHLADPVFEAPGFERASQDRYFLALEPVEGASEFAMRLGALRTAEVEL